MDLQSISRETITSYSIQGNATTMAANRLSYFLNQHGPSVTYNTACSSSMVALHYAIESIRKKECPWAIVGGCNALIDPRLFVGKFLFKFSIHRLGYNVTRWKMLCIRC